MFRIWETSCVLFFLNLQGCNLTSFARGEAGYLSSDDNTVAAGAGRDVSLLLVGGAARVGGVIVSAAGTTTVELDAVTRAGDAVSFAGAAQG